MPEILERLLQQGRFEDSEASLLGIVLALVVSAVAALLVRLLYRLFYEDSETGSQIDRSFLLLGPSITTLFLTTALFNQVVREAPGAFDGVREVFFGGEAADPRLVRELLARGGPGRLVNVYGPT